MGSQRFTDASIRALKPDPNRDRYEIQDAATPGLRLRVSRGGTKTWVYVYRLSGRLRRMTLGQYPALSLAKARAEATSGKVARDDGQDPAAAATAERQAKRQAATVKELTEEYIARYAMKSKKSWREDERLLNREVIPHLGRHRAVDVRRGDVIDLLEKIADRAPIVANRTLAVLRRAYNWAIEVDFSGIESSPCFRVRAPAKEHSKDRVLNSAEIKAVWAALGQDREAPLPSGWPSRPTRLALKLALVTGQRINEIAGAHIDEFDFQSGWWTIPASRAKNDFAHRVPLTGLALELIEEMFNWAGDSDWLLRSPRGHRPINPNALTRAAARLRPFLSIPHWSPHDFRRTAASAMASKGVPRLVISKVLNHVETGVTAIYDRHSYDAEKREALEVWEVRLRELIA